MGNKIANFQKKGHYVIDAVHDFAAQLIAKGSALAALDVVEVLTIPAKCIVMAAGITPIAVANSTTLTLDLGDGTDVDRNVDGFDAKATTDGVPIMTVEKYYPTADTLDLTYATLTGTLTTGSVRVWAIVIDIS